MKESNKPEQLTLRWVYAVDAAGRSGLKAVWTAEPSTPSAVVHYAA